MRFQRSQLALVAAIALAAARPAAAEPPAKHAKPTHDASFDAIIAASEAAAEVIQIDDTAPAEAASSVHLGHDELAHRLRTQVSDVLRQVPGLMVAQHAGGGKSDQYFIRGFDADHGTDLAIYADGVPVNMPSHGHGQGYADTHFLIPETIDSVDVHKGPYAARFGDFYTAGAMELSTIDHVDAPTVWLAGSAPLDGPEGFARLDPRLVGMASPDVRGNPGDRSLVAVQLGNTDGPFVHPQDFRQGNALVKWRGQVGAGELSLESMWYSSRWDASGQLPESAVESGLVDRFGALDPSEGGHTSRTSLAAGYTLRDGHGGTWRAHAYGIGYAFQLFSNFTLFARDPVHGDEIEQDDARFTYGLDAAYDRRVDLHGMDSLFTVGAQLRSDDVTTALWHVQQRARLGECFAAGANPCNDDADRITDVAAYAEGMIHVWPHVHVLPGLRVERLAWSVLDVSPAARGDALAGAAAATGKAIVLPKLSVEIEATPQLDVFANAGSGFHSNDARGAVTAGGAGALARALGAEAGVRTTVLPHARLSADLWYLHLDSELVWNGDEGGTDAAGATRRYGLDLEASYRPVPWLELDANASLAHAGFVANAGNGSAVALAPRLMGQGGITLTRGASFVALRGRGIADRPGNASGTLTARGYFLLDLIAGTRLGRFAATLSLANLLDTPWREAQFADTSAITPGSAPVEQMHFTPGIPLTATLELSTTL